MQDETPIQPVKDEHYKMLLCQLLTSMNRQQTYVDHPADGRLLFGAMAHIELLREVLQDHGKLVFDEDQRTYRLWLATPEQILLVGKQEQP